VASQRPGVRRRTGLTDADAAAAAWCVADGVRVGGARAIALAVAVAWGRTVPLWPWRVPGVPRLLDVLYDLVAANRARLPGVTPWCAAHPGECDDG
jgi:predicted DCC family thiol-disulfide oxidoreductase YuxK